MSNSAVLVYFKNIMSMYSFSCFSLEEGIATIVLGRDGFLTLAHF